MPILEINNLTKIYNGGVKKNEIKALDDFSLKIEEGTIFGLLGQNGAGKTTLIKILLGITFPTKGTFRIFDSNTSLEEAKMKIGYLPENHKFPNFLTGNEVLKYFGMMSGLSGKSLELKISEMLELVDMTKWGKTKVKVYSKGMMQRLGLAQALIHDPQLIFLDEPTDGVDPIGRKEIRNLLILLKEKGKTIFLNSHLLSEVELVTDHIAIMNRGKLIKEGNVLELTKKEEVYNIILDVNLEELFGEHYLTNNSLSKVADRTYTIRVQDSSEFNLLIDKLRASGVTIKEFSQQKNSLEDIFISLVNEAEKGISK
ncbi:MAG: ABC transporter ATP-binding protein [Chlorobiaceae bacterium]|nr:ABC transporter ATP-binding protein [Chlorobiaceae bacterium]MBA4310780.1 ABC transporter ATP-binding protein [Chlorobiaceae bacterium]